MTIERNSLELLQEALEILESGFKELPDFRPHVDINALRPVLLDVATKMKDNYPYPHPFYLGQMMKPPHPAARLAYMLSLWVNPNNHALDGGKASSSMEKEAVAEIARMFGWEAHLGHLCSGGTMANLEALWVAGRLHPGTRIVASSQAHYTHERICGVLNLPFQAVPCDQKARMNVGELERLLEDGEIGTVVATLGTTATGSIDPLPEILDLRARFGFRLHVDSAYGGYFALIDNLTPATRAAFDRLSEVDSIVVDPHKHGLQPYGCGSVLFRDPAVGKLYKHDSAYTYFTSSELHLGEISLECSRPGSAAVALWATQQLLPMVTDGAFAADLNKSRSAALELFNRLKRDPRFMVPIDPELDIVVWAPTAETTSEISRLSTALFETAAANNIHLALAKFPKSLFGQTWNHVHWDEDHVTCLRSCLMKPEHLDWIDRIWDTLETAMSTVLSRKPNA